MNSSSRRYTGPDRRETNATDSRIDALERALADGLGNVDRRLDRGSERMDDMQAELTANTTVTTEVRDLLATARSGIKVLGWIGNAGLWLVKAAGVLATAGMALYAAWYAVTHGGDLPRK